MLNKNNITTKNIEVITLSDGTVEEIKCTQERATEIVDAIYKNNSEGLDLYFNNCELLTELAEGKGYYTLGYENFKEFAEAVFDSGQTQAKNMRLVCKSFGKENEDGTWTIRDKDKLSNFSITQLLYIRGLKEFNGNITECCMKYGIDISNTRNLPTLTLRKLVAYEKKNDFITLDDFKAKLNKQAIEDKASNKSDTDDKGVKEDKVSRVTAKDVEVLKKANNELQVQYNKVKADNEQRKDFRKSIIEIINSKETDAKKIKAIKALVKNTK